MNYDPIELARAAEEAGIPLMDVKKWLSDPTVANSPRLRGVSAADAVKLYRVGQNAIQQVTQTGGIDLAGLTQPKQSVTVTGQRPPIPTTVNPYAGTRQEATASDGNPAAGMISQFDPEARRAAERMLQERWAEGQRGRDIQNVLAGAVAGFTGGQSQSTARDMQKSQ
jgi:hypothetical protein